MKINAVKMSTPIEEKIEKNQKVRAYTQPQTSPLDAMNKEKTEFCLLRAEFIIVFEFFICSLSLPVELT